MVWNLILGVSGDEAFILVIGSTVGVDHAALAVPCGGAAARG